MCCDRLDNGQTSNALRFIFNTNIGINCTDSMDVCACSSFLNGKRMDGAQIEQNKYKFSHTIYTLIYFTLNVHTLLFCSTWRVAAEHSTTSSHCVLLCFALPSPERRRNGADDVQC